MNNDTTSNKFKTLGVVILAVCMLAIGFTAGKLIDIDPASSLKNLVTDEPDLNLFWTVWDVMENKFVSSEEEVTTEDKKYGAIKGLVNSYDDPATIFLTPEETESFNSTNEGKYFEGIGAELGYEDGYIIVITPLEGSPAKEAGIRPGDIILSVDGGELSKGDSIYEVVEIIRGEAGTTVTLEVLHKGDMEATEIEITRGEITVPSMTVEFVDGIARIDLARFTDASYLTWVSNWEEIVEEVVENGTKKIILDLRSNPGGFFDAAIYAADDFIDGVETLSIQEDGQGRQKEFNSKKGGKLTGMEIIVLVDAGSG